MIEKGQKWTYSDGASGVQVGKEFTVTDVNQGIVHFTDGTRDSYQTIRFFKYWFKSLEGRETLWKSLLTMMMGLQKSLKKLTEQVAHTIHRIRYKITL